MKEVLVFQHFPQVPNMVSAPMESKWSFGIEKHRKTLKEGSMNDLR